MPVPYCINYSSMIEWFEIKEHDTFSFVLLKIALAIWGFFVQLSSVQFSCSVMSNSATPWTAAHQAALSITNSQIYPNSCPLSRWCHLTISSSVVPFSSHPQSFPASGSFQWVSSSCQVVKLLEFQLQHQSFQWIPRNDFV